MLRQTLRKLILKEIKKSEIHKYKSNYLMVFEKVDNSKVYLNTDDVSQLFHIQERL